MMQNSKSQSTVALMFLFCSMGVRSKLGDTNISPIYEEKATGFECTPPQKEKGYEGENENEQK